MRGFRQRDLAVIGTLWASEFIHPWVKAGANHTILSILLSQQYSLLTVLEKNNDVYYYAAVLVFQYTTCLVLAFVVDLRNHKFDTYLGLFCVYVLTPVFGLVAISTKSIHCTFLLPWLNSFHLISLPIKFCLIYNQNPNALEWQISNVVYIFDFFQSMSVYIQFCIFPPTQVFSQQTLILLWVFLIMITCILVVITVVVRKYKNDDLTKEKSIALLLRGICRDAKNRRNMLRFFVLLLILLPLLKMAALDVILLNTAKNDKDSFSQQSSMNLGEMLCGPIVGIILLGATGLFEQVTGLILISLAHGFNITSLILAIIRFHKADTNINALSVININNNLSTWKNFVGPIPRPGVAVVEVFNQARTKIQIKSTYYETPQESYQLKGYGSHNHQRDVFEVKVGSKKVEFELQISSHNMRTTMLQRIVITESKLYTYIVYGNLNSFTRFISVEGFSHILPQRAPILIVINAIKGAASDDESTVKSNHLIVESLSNGKVQTLMNDHFDHISFYTNVTVGTVAAKYSFASENPRVSKEMMNTVAEAKYDAKPYNVDVILISDIGKLHMEHFTIMRNETPYSEDPRVTVLPSESTKKSDDSKFTKSENVNTVTRSLLIPENETAINDAAPPVSSIKSDSTTPAKIPTSSGTFHARTLHPQSQVSVVVPTEHPVKNSKKSNSSTSTIPPESRKKPATHELPPDSLTSSLVSSSTPKNRNHKNITTKKPSVASENERSPKAGLERDDFYYTKVLPLARGIFGLSKGAATLGAIRFLWTESPQRLRTTLLACYIVSYELVSEFGSATIKKCEKKEATVLLVICIVGALWHVMLCMLHYRISRS